MANDMDSALERLQQKLQQQLDQVRKTKTAINALCEAFDRPAIYTDIEQEGAIKQIRSDQFYGQPLATCVRSILEMRKAADRGAASVNEIFDALKAGGYAFETKDDENAKNGLRQSMRKNTIFHKLPGGQWGLLTWYPNAKVEKGDEDEAEVVPLISLKAEKPSTTPAPKSVPKQKDRDAVENEKAASST
jgi:hypothetical protein